MPVCFQSLAELPRWMTMLSVPSSLANFTLVLTPAHPLPVRHSSRTKEHDDRANISPASMQAKCMSPFSLFSLEIPATGLTLFTLVLFLLVR